MKNLLYNKLFIFGLFLKLFLIFIIDFENTNQWVNYYIRFISQDFSFNPWGTWIASEESMLAFPYGYGMYFIAYPFFRLFSFFDFSLAYTYKIFLFISDFILLYIFTRTYKNNINKIIKFYWISPILVIPTYLLGFNDIVPIIFLASSLLALKNYNFITSSILLCIAISVKLSMVLALPFYLLYVFNNKSLRQRFNVFIIGLLIGLLFVASPFIASHSALLMILNHPDINSLFTSKINFINSFDIYVFPMIYTFIIYYVWRLRRLNFELFQVICGSTFLLIALLSPLSPGWFVWSIPFLIAYQIHSKNITFIVILSFSFLYFVLILLIYPIFFLQGGNFSLQEFINQDYIYQLFISLIMTLFFVIGIIIFARIWRDSIYHNAFFRMSRDPFVIGISGDSGSGKDTLANSIESLFGSHSTAKISGDNYHLWDRHKSIWRHTTPLNPLANDVDKFSDDLSSLKNGYAIDTSVYDHTIGKVSHLEKTMSNDLIIASGLHTLLLPSVRNNLDLSIFLDIDEDLRNFFKLKRDSNERGMNFNQIKTSIKKREKDSSRFIKPQINFADVILKLTPLYPKTLSIKNINKNPRLKLEVNSKIGANEQYLIRTLISLCGLNVSFENYSDLSTFRYHIEGDVSSEDLQLASHVLFPNINEYLDIKPIFYDGIHGIMQLIVLNYINELLKRKSYN